MNQSGVIEKVFRDGWVDNIFIILAVQKSITFSLRDIRQNGREMLDQLYMEGRLI